MPGLIDAHIHVVLTEVNLRLLSDVPLTLLAAKGSVAMRAMLHRGFTTLRDTGGADYGMKAAVEQGLFEGPRLFIAGAPLSQTGGHADHRLRTQDRVFCACCSGLAWTARVADGVPEVIKATRDELRKGADHIKIMVSGGVASQADPLESLQYRIDEIEAAVDEATRWGTYVCAHAYSAQGDRARGDRRRAHHRARQPDRRAHRAADGRARRVSGADAGRLRCVETPRPGLRTFQLQPGEERTGAARRPALAGDRPQRRREDRLRLATCSASCRTITATSSPSAARP